MRVLCSICIRTAVVEHFVSTLINRSTGVGVSPRCNVGLNEFSDMFLMHLQGLLS
jgi:hypothetical protein